MKGKKIADYINVDTISLDLKSKNKNAVIKELYEGIKNKETMKNEELGLSDIYTREAGKNVIRNIIFFVFFAI